LFRSYSQRLFQFLLAVETHVCVCLIAWNKYDSWCCRLYVPLYTFYFILMEERTSLCVA